MRLDPKALALAAGMAAAILFLICAIAVALAPDATAALGGILFHADVSAFTRSLTWGNFIGGLLGWGAGTAIVSWMVAALYNGLTGARGHA